MNKLQQLKQAMSNPPPQRLAKIEYQSYLLQGIGIIFVCAMLIYKGLWYIIFAMIFGVGVSYSAGMGAYQKYKAIMSLVEPEKEEDFEKDISPSRRRSKIINSVMGIWSRSISIFIGVVSTVLIIDPTISRWWLMVLYPTTMIFIYLFTYFFILYWICYPIYKRRLSKGG